jgi:hypothetical protein
MGRGAPVSHEPATTTAATTTHSSSVACCSRRSASGVAAPDKAAAAADADDDGAGDTVCHICSAKLRCTICRSSMKRRKKSAPPSPPTPPTPSTAGLPRDGSSADIAYDGPWPPVAAAAAAAAVVGEATSGYPIWARSCKLHAPRRMASTKHPWVAQLLLETRVAPIITSTVQTPEGSAPSEGRLRRSERVADTAAAAACPQPRTLFLVPLQLLHFLPLPSAVLHLHQVCAHPHPLLLLLCLPLCVLLLLLLMVPLLLSSGRKW